MINGRYVATRNGVPIGVMPLHIYDPDKDGLIALAQLVAAVCSETEADGKISTHETGGKHRWTLDKLLKGAGAGADPTEIDVPSFDIFDKFREFVSWNSIDGLTSGGDSGYSCTPGVAGLRLATAAVTDYDAWAYNYWFWYGLCEAGKLLTVEFQIIELMSLINQNIWLRLAEYADDPPSEICDHFGWKIIGADLYASNANGTTQTITDTGVNIPQYGQRTRLKIVWNPGVDLKFYVDDVLKVTHTTNLPIYGEYTFHAHIRTLQAGIKSIVVGRVLMEREY